jgi:hypothetical protein
MLASKYSGNSNCIHYETPAATSLHSNGTSVGRAGMHMNVYICLEAKKTKQNKRCHEAQTFATMYVALTTSRRLSLINMPFKKWMYKIHEKYHRNLPRFFLLLLRNSI